MITEPLASPKSKTWKGRVAKQLRKIQGTSPSSPTAPHPEGATIGVPLEDCPPVSLYFNLFQFFIYSNEMYLLNYYNQSFQILTSFSLRQLVILYAI